MVYPSYHGIWGSRVCTWGTLGMTPCTPLGGCDPVYHHMGYHTVPSTTPHTHIHAHTTILQYHVPLIHTYMHTPMHPGYTHAHTPIPDMHSLSPRGTTQNTQMTTIEVLNRPRGCPRWPSGGTHISIWGCASPSDSPLCTPKKGIAFGITF